MFESLSSCTELLQCGQAQCKVCAEHLVFCVLKVPQEPRGLILVIALHPCVGAILPGSC